MIELKQYVYGLVDAPRRWFETLTGYLKTDLKGKQSKLAPSVFPWHGPQGQLRGIMMIQVDDVARGGTADWFQEVAQPHTRNNSIRELAREGRETLRPRAITES